MNNSDTNQAEQLRENAVITGAYKDFTLKSMSDFVLMLRNRTLSELVKDFHRNFKMPIWNGNQSEMVKDMLAIDAIQWKLTGEYVKFLKLPFTIEDFIGEKALFQGFEVKTKTAFNNGYDFVCDNNEIFYRLWYNPVTGWELSKGLKTIEDLVIFKPKLTDLAIKRIFG